MTQRMSTFDEVGSARLGERENQVRTREQKIWENFRRKHLREVVVDRRRQPEQVPEIIPPAEVPVVPSPTMVNPPAEQTSVSVPVAPIATPDARIQSGHHIEKTPATNFVSPAVAQPAAAPAYTEAPAYAAAAATDATPEENKMALFSIVLSFFAAIAGAVFTTMNPEHGFDAHSWLYLAGFGFVTLAIWFLGILPLGGEEIAHAGMGWLSPILWGFVCFAWPAVGAVKLCAALAAGGSLFSQLFALLIPFGVAIWGISSMWHVGTAMTMSPPWPKVIGSDFSGWGGLWVWVLLISTLVVNYNTYRHATAWPAFNAFVHSQAQGNKRLDELVAVINAQKSLSHKNNHQAARDITKALQGLDDLEKPATGNRKKALALKNEAAALEKNGDSKSAIKKYKAAYEADPADARNAIALANAASAARDYDLAVRHLREALLIDPRSAEAWIALGHNYLYGHSRQPEAVAIAANYYVTGYWFSANRKNTLKHLRTQADAEPKNSPGARAAKQALAKITGQQQAR